MNEITIDIPEGAKLVKNTTKNRSYLRIENCPNHPLSTFKGTIPYHRYVLYESLGKSDGAKCHWCGYLLPWKTSLMHASVHVINADHLDNDPANNDPDNLVPACHWCNANRTWAEAHPDFWQNWRQWLAHVPPAFRPNLATIAEDFGIDASATLSNMSHVSEV